MGFRGPRSQGLRTEDTPRPDGAPLTVVVVRGVSVVDSRLRDVLPRLGPFPSLWVRVSCPSSFLKRSRVSWYLRWGWGCRPWGGTGTVRRTRPAPVTPREFFTPDHPLGRRDSAHSGRFVLGRSPLGSSSDRTSRVPHPSVRRCVNRENTPTLSPMSGLDREELSLFSCD